jgi:hypothetical protein
MKPKHTDDVRVLNDGLHSKRALNTVRQLLTAHDLKDAVLYQIILSGSQSKPEYQATMKALIRHIRTKCRAEYIGAYEVGEEKGGLHTHMFVIIEAKHHFPSDLLDVREGEWIARRIKRTGLSIRIEPPKNRMHGGAMFARMNTPAKLENCINWATYILKLRSKDDVPGRETYFGSEFVSNITKREAKRQKYRDALTTPSPAAPSAAEETEQPKGNHEDITTQEQHILPLGSFPGANQEGADSSTEALVCTGQQTSTGEEGRSEASSASPERHSGQGTSPHREGIEMTLTTAQKYVGLLYERCVDQGLDVDEVRRYLLEHGVVRTPGQVAYELEHVYEFHGYVDTHPAKSRMSVRDWDRAIGPA